MKTARKKETPKFHIEVFPDHVEVTEVISIRDTDILDWQSDKELQKKLNFYDYIGTLVAQRGCYDD